MIRQFPVNLFDWEPGEILNETIFAKKFPETIPGIGIVTNARVNYI
jgi:hypothetical protein